jgi:hypothetical protein
VTIVVSDLDGVLDDITLGDDANGAIIVDPPLLPSTKRPPQIEPLAMSDRQFARGTGNRLTSFAWRVAYDFADTATADQFVKGHDLDVPINAKITVNDDSPSSYSSAVITEVTMEEHYGTAVTVRYSVDGAVPTPAEFEGG